MARNVSAYLSAQTLAAVAWMRALPIWVSELPDDESARRRPQPYCITLDLYSHEYATCSSYWCVALMRQTSPTAQG